MTTFDLGAEFGITTEHPVALVQPDADSRLEQLLAGYDAIKAAKDAAVKAFDDLTDSIKRELITAAPGSNDIRVESDYLTQALRLSASTRTTLDTKRLKADFPGIETEYGKTSTVWSLRGMK